MEGPKNPNNETEGMIPRAVTQVFVTAMELEEKGWKVCERHFSILLLITVLLVNFCTNKTYLIRNQACYRFQM